MPTWLILALAVAIVVLVAFVTAFLRVRRDQDKLFEPAMRSVRARLESVSYEIDTSAVNVDTTEPGRLRDTAEAMLATADDRRSARVCGRAEQLLQRAEHTLQAARHAVVSGGAQGEK